MRCSEQTADDQSGAPQNKKRRGLGPGVSIVTAVPPKRQGKTSSMPRPNVKAIGAEQAQRSPGFGLSASAARLYASDEHEQMPISAGESPKNSAASARVASHCAACGTRPSKPSCLSRKYC